MADKEPIAPAVASASVPAAPQAEPAQVTAATPPAAAETPAAPAGAPSVPASEPSLLQTVTAEAPKETAAPEAKAAAPKPEPKPAEPGKPAEPKPGEAVKPADAKPAEKPAEAKPGEPKPAEAAAAVEPPKLEAVEYKYTLPESIKLDDTARKELHTVLDEFRANPAEGAQKLVDYHNTRMQQYADHVAQEQRRVFNDYRKENRTKIMADPQLGGSGFKTTSAAVARMRDLLVPKEMLAPRKFDDGSPRLSEADEFLETTGAGDHPVLWHILHNAARYLDEPAPPPPNARPNPASQKPGRGRLRDMYDHPRSNGQS